MSNAPNFYDSDDDDDGEDIAFGEDSGIQWSNIIFLPFHRVFKMFVLMSVIIKTILGPVQSVHQIVYCYNTMDKRRSLKVMKFLYLYLCDPIYGIDTLLHMVHRQVTDEAMRREHLPKSAFLIVLDVISLIPMIRLVTGETCPPITFWPNILNFSEFIIIYRIAEYFSILTTHSYWRLGVGYTLITFISINCVACFLLLLTASGLCRNCDKTIHDWRKHVLEYPDGDATLATYVFAVAIVHSHVVNRALNIINPSTYMEFLYITVLIIASYLKITFAIFPKMFAEALLRLRLILVYHPVVQRIIQETERKNPCAKAYLDVKNFYSLVWKKRGGITNIPEVIMELPKYLRVDIRQDLFWPVFCHSPTFRKTSVPFKRWICEHIRLEYKLPGEKFFAGPYCHTHLYYLKSGIAQLISADDGITPLISVTSGTILGDICFFLPHGKRKVIVRCLTYCEVLSLTRLNIVQALHIHPEDRRLVIQSAKERIKHARTLYTCKQHIRGLDRSEDEGIAWVKRRWWQISDTISKWKRRPVKKEHAKCELPPEEAVYHCAKYIGQLVLCTEEQLQMTSMFTNAKFPWIFAPESAFKTIWRRIVATTVFLVLTLYPPFITSLYIPPWFTFFQMWTDVVYVADIFVSLLTSTTRQDNTLDNFAAVMFARCKTTKFALDFLSAIWIENLVVLGGLPEMYYPCQFNRLIKIYVLFPKWDIDKNPVVDICYKTVMIQHCFMYIVAYVLYFLNFSLLFSKISTTYFFGNAFCNAHDPKEKCQSDKPFFLAVYLAWVYEFEYCIYYAQYLMDLYVMIIISYFCFLVCIFCQTYLVAGLYLKYKEEANYQYFVSNINSYYKHYNIHPGLLERLNRYLICHWRYYKGMDVMHPELLKNEPYDIWFKVHGEVAEKIIKQSSAFTSADPALIKELAYKAKFLILPKKSPVFLCGIQCKTIVWCVQGHMKSEYYEKGGLIKKNINPGELVSTLAVFLGKPSPRTVETSTDCEILYLKIQDFFTILKHYPVEWEILKNCTQRYSGTFEAVCEGNDNWRKECLRKSKVKETISDQRNSRDRLTVRRDFIKHPFTDLAWFEPETTFIRAWMLMRAITVAISITCAALQGGSGAGYRRLLIVIGALCDTITIVDITLKLFLGYYDHRGLLITDKRKCLLHYLSHGFVLDVIGILPASDLYGMLSTTNIDENSGLIMNTVSKFAHIYLLTGYFDYIADTPIVNVAYIKILKWQVVTILVMLGASHYLVNWCIELKWDSAARLQGMARRNGCWIPSEYALDETPTMYQLHTVFAVSFMLAESSLGRVNLDYFQIWYDQIGLRIIVFIFAIMSWFITCYSMALLVLNLRGNTIFQHAVSQLRQFLQAERVEDKVLRQVLRHFRYWWLRTKGINMQNLMNERLGVIFRQDLSYYFLKKTFEALNTILHGGEVIERALCNVTTLHYFLPGEEIVREMDLVPWVYIVHRGKILVKKNSEKIAVLTKGSIFGQLSGNKLRPVRMSAAAEDHADVLQIPFHSFQELASTGEVAKNIADNPQSEDDYMAIKKPVTENPYNTVRYIIQGAKAIQLPWLKAPMYARNRSWYCRWLITAWFLCPTLSATLTLILVKLPAEYVGHIYWCLIICDIVHLLNFISEFFTVVLFVENGKCIDQPLLWRYFKKISCYADILSLIFPLFSYVNGNYHWEFARLLRLHLFYQFHRHFSSGFKSTTAPILLKIVIVSLIFHAMACGWMYVACREKMSSPLMANFNSTVDYTEWMPASEREGCAVIKYFLDANNTVSYTLLVPKDWRADYLVAMFYILVDYTRSPLYIVSAITLKQLYYSVVFRFIASFIYVWILGMVISAIYTKLRTLYYYDCSVQDLLTYLEHNGLSPVLLKSVREYTKQLWQRQKGNWLPELAHQAPQCLREDIFAALYMHHLETPPLFQGLPQYFIRQMVSRLHRMVVFPGKFLVQQGDIFSTVYFVHEGEIEKWHTDKSGEKKLISIITANGYFGIVPGLFPNTPFQYSYFSRTVVDMVYLRHKDWQDLLQGYPDIMQDLVAAGRHLKKTMGYDIK